MCRSTDSGVLVAVKTLRRKADEPARCVNIPGVRQRRTSQRGSTIVSINQPHRVFFSFSFFSRLLSSDHQNLTLFSSLSTISFLSLTLCESLCLLPLATHTCLISLRYLLSLLAGATSTRRSGSCLSCGTRTSCRCSASSRRGSRSASSSSTWPRATSTSSCAPPSWRARRAAPGTRSSGEQGGAGRRAAQTEGAGWIGATASGRGQGTSGEGEGQSGSRVVVDWGHLRCGQGWIEPQVGGATRAHEEQGCQDAGG